jgi:hypothetical protein
MSIAEEHQSSLFPDTRRIDDFHNDLYIAGARELRAIENVGISISGSQLPLATIQGEVASVLEDLIIGCASNSDILPWLLLEDYPVARTILGLDSRSKSDRCVGTVAARFKALAGETDLIGDAYCEAIPAALRHRLGEHYTPMWLVARMTRLVEPGKIVADPACGDGRFIGSLIQHGHRPASLWAGDLNPLAVMMARYEIWKAAGRPDTPPCSVEWFDFLLDQSYAGQRSTNTLPKADTYIGNPPWVTWRTIPSNYRRRLAKKWQTSTLNVRRGWEARVSAGQTDLCHLFIHECIEQCNRNGEVFFVLPRSTFKGPVGSAPIRNGISSSGREYCYSEVWEIDSQDAFVNVRSDTVVARLFADRKQQYPVPWLTIGREQQEPIRSDIAQPSDARDPNSSWVTDEKFGKLQLRPDTPDATLRARGGINTGGANSAFHVNVLDSREGIARVVNVLSRKASRDTPQIEMEIEQEYLRPLLRGRDIVAWKARPALSIVVPHEESDLRRTVPEETLAQNAPRTLAYLKVFEDLLSGRKELARWGGDWYALFRIGAYTANCWRVVWPHSSGQNFRAALLTPEDRTVPDQKVILLPFDREDEAMFYMAVLNSNIVRELIRSSSGLDASPSLVKRLPLPQRNVSDTTQAEIVEFAHKAFSAPDSVDQDLLDKLVGSFYRTR